jgi:putative transposase
MKSSEISEVDLTSKEKDFLPYWNKFTEDVSKKLLLLTEIGFADLDLRYSSKYASSPTQNSRFSTSQQCHRNKKWYPICAVSFMFSPVEFMDSEDMLMGSKKIRVYPKTKEQKKLLESFCDASRFYYNKTVAYLKQEGTKANRFQIQKELLKEVPDWAEKVPYKVKQMAIDDACNAVKNAKKKYLKKGTFNQVNFRKKKHRKDSFYIPKQSVNETGIFPRILKGLRLTEEIKDVEFDCRFIHDDGRYWICIPYKKKIKVPENQRKSFISLDPGVRTFLSGYMENEEYCKIGETDFNRIFRLLYRLDSCISKKSKGSKVRYNRAISSLRFKVKNLIKEIHSKVANILVRNFDNIIIPKFTPSQKMLSKLRSKTCRSLLTWSHGKFLELLSYKAKEYSSKLFIQNESYTSKTCSFCGKINKIGSKKILKCSCGTVVDRDFNGARGIFLRAMIDHPELNKLCIG